MSDRYDVVILGGAFSGASAAILLRRELPQLRVLIVEKAEAFDEKVGEATTEMSAMFLTRRLAMWQHLENEQLPKEGLRYWFSNEKVTGHANASETGGFIRSTVPAFQLRRDALDEHLLGTAVAEGAEIWRPAKVRMSSRRRFRPSHHGRNRRRDPRGPVPLAARRHGTREFSRAPSESHRAQRRASHRRHLVPLEERPPHRRSWRCASASPARNISSRRLATNHYTGYGYWIWVIPLGNGETSVGVVFDKRLIDLHHSKNRAEDFIAFLKAIPALSELLDGAEPRLEDLRFYSHLAVRHQAVHGPGWALLGDAAAFLDPYYSPGLDHASFTVRGHGRDHQERRDGRGRRRPSSPSTTRPSSARTGASSAPSYKDKYYYMGESDLLCAAFLIDTAQYYIFVVIPAYRFLKKFDWMPVLGPKPAFISYHLMQAYNRRFKAIALARRAAGRGGYLNDGRRVKAYFNLGLAPMHMVGRGLKLWLRAEAGTVGLMWKKLWRRKPAAATGSESVEVVQRESRPRP